MIDPESIRRHLLIVGVTEYQPGWAEIRDGVEAELELAEKLFLGPFGYDRRTFRRLVDTTQTAIKNGIADWLEQLPRTANDFVTIYWTGHGVVDHTVFRLITSDVKVE